MEKPFTLVMAGFKLFLITLGDLTLMTMIIDHTGNIRLGLIIGIVAAVCVLYHYYLLDKSKTYLMKLNGYTIPISKDYYDFLKENQLVYEGLLMASKLPHQMLFKGKTIFVVFPKGKEPQ